MALPTPGAHLPAPGASEQPPTHFPPTPTPTPPQPHPYSCAAFFVYSAWLVYQCRNTSAQADVTTVTIRDYSVWVRNLPGDCEPDELAAFMEQVRRQPPWLAYSLGVGPRQPGSPTRQG
jgi:hypothetical protein